MRSNIPAENLNLFINMAIAKFAGALGAISEYSSICGGYVEGVQQWCTHNVEDIVEAENWKYVGWSVTLADKEKPLQIFIKKSALDYIGSSCTTFKHAKNTFAKHCCMKF